MENKENMRYNDKKREWFYVKTLYKFLLKLFENCYMTLKMLKTVWKMLKIMLKTCAQEVRIVAIKCMKEMKINKINRVLTKMQKNQNSNRIQWLRELIKFIIYSRNIFTFLICNGARSFASRLAGCLAFPATSFVAVVYSAVY